MTEKPLKERVEELEDDLKQTRIRFFNEIEQLKNQIKVLEEKFQDVHKKS